MLNLSEELYEFVWLWFPDIRGKIRCLTIPKEIEKNVVEKGIGFDGFSVGLAPIEDSDLILKPDETSSSILKMERNLKRYFCYVLTPERKPCPLDSRYVLRRTLEGVKNEFGWEFLVAPEIEFFLLKKGKPLDTEIYFGFSNDLGESLRRNISRELFKVGILPRKNHHEVAPGQYEINFKYDNALRAADNTLTFKEIVRYVARKWGLEANFMPKPFKGINGSGMHCHINLRCGKRNLFYDEKKGGLSEIALYFIGGLLEHAKGISAIIAPTVNSYKRLVPGYEAPNLICWGYRNRSAMIRVPLFNRKDCRIELRSPDPSCNPYLAFSVILAAGIDGIERCIDPGPPLQKNAYRRNDLETLPGSLGEALEEMEKDGIAKKVLGDELYQKFLSLKKKEWDDYRLEVSEWEWRMYSSI